MKFQRISFGTLGLLAVGGIAWGCSDKANDCNANKTCDAYGGESGASGTSGANGKAGTSGAGGKSGAGSSGDAGTAGDTGDSGSAGAAGTGEPACDPTANPDSEPCVIGNGYGLFVSVDGDDRGDGTQEAPFATVTKALAVAGAGAVKRIYVCSDVYAEPNTLSIPDKVSMFGGFTCDGGWAYDAKFPAQLSPEAPIGAKIESAKTGVTLQDIRINAKDAANGNGASSFGLTINGSKNVLLKRVEIHAGKGGTGAPGIVGATGADGLEPSPSGTNASCVNPPAAQSGGQSLAKICGSQGGNGGAAKFSANYAASQDGESGFMVEPTNGGKGSNLVGQNGTVGLGGANGSPGSAGALAPAIGTFSTAGYGVASGGSGTAGQPGQGGGGGGASLGSATCVGSSGGAGGMGGCAGGFGTGGSGGGASVSVFSWNSVVTIEGCRLIATDGGAGAKGGAAGFGGVGKDGGKGGVGTAAIGDGGAGGKGGRGGRGGSGSGGTGGPSVGLVYNGIEPTVLKDSTITLGNGGAAGLGGRPDMNDPTTWAPDGKVGVAEAIYPKPPAQ